MQVIRIQNDMAACTCGWFVNTLTDTDALVRAHLHGRREHYNNVEIIDERHDPNTERVTL